MKSLKAEGNALSDTRNQLKLLEADSIHDSRFIRFDQKLHESGLYPLKPLAVKIFQVNIGKMCNQVCRHCHVDAGPDRKEIMSKEIMELCLGTLEMTPSLEIVDITGGAPELNPNFKWFVEKIKELNKHIIVRSNLTIILSNKKHYDLPEFFRKNKIEVISSLPFYSRDRTDRQRGDGVFDDSIKALKRLNGEGYGKEGSGLILNLVYNPSGAFLPPGQAVLEADYRFILSRDYAVEFNNLYTITNVPIGRFLHYLLQSGNYERYLDKLILAYNPVTARNVMCRDTISVGWEGTLYDCDFNQMLELPVSCNEPHISAWNTDALQTRNIVTKQHCYACTAGAGSSCCGAIA
jgi:radical SAM/Cys-rich protein